LSGFVANNAPRLSIFLRKSKKQRFISQRYFSYPFFLSLPCASAIKPQPHFSSTSPVCHWLTQ